MIAFFWNPTEQKYWVRHVMMRPNHGDIVIDEDGKRWFVDHVIMQFSESVGLIHGVVIFSLNFTPIAEDYEKLCECWEEQVTKDLMLNRPDLLLGTIEWNHE